MSNVKSQLTYKLITMGTGMLAAAASGVIAKAAWKAFSNEAPPNPENPDTQWKDAVIWTVATALAAGVTRILMMRGANQGWRAFTGELPQEAGLA